MFKNYFNLVNINGTVLHNWRKETASGIECTPASQDNDTEVEHHNSLISCKASGVHKRLLGQKTNQESCLVQVRSETVMQENRRIKRKS